MKKVLRSLVVFFVAMFVLAGCSSSGNAARKAAASLNQIVVTYQLKQNGKAFAKKTIDQPKKSVVYDKLALKKGWTVKASKGFITEIAGKQGDCLGQKVPNWLYTINGEMAQKGATEQPVKNHDKVVFDLSVTK